MMKNFGIALLFLIVVTPAASAAARGQGNVAVTPPQISRTKSCPAGFELNGKKCEATEIVSPNFVCPSGTSMIDGQCSTFSRATRQCQAPHQRLNGESCVSTESSLAEFQCSSGSLDASSRSCRQTKEVAPVCPAGFVEQSKRCVRYSSKQIRCPVGYTLQGKECARRVSYPAEPTCPASFVLSNDKSCTRLVPIPPRCEVGYTMEGDECVRSVSKVPSACPKGFDVVGNSCQQTLQHPARLVCPNDMELNASNQCLKHAPIPPTCPSGSQRSSSGQCEIPVGKVPVCEDGFQLEKNGKKPLCRLILKFPTSQRCTAGYSLIHGKCKKASAQVPEQRCAEGILKDGWCATQSVVDPSAGCPEGFRLTKGPACTQDVAYDCSQSTTRTVCDMPSFVAQLLEAPQSKSQRFLNANYKHKSSAPQHTDRRSPPAAKCLKSSQRRARRRRKPLFAISVLTIPKLEGSSASFSRHQKPSFTALLAVLTSRQVSASLLLQFPLKKSALLEVANKEKHASRRRVARH